MTADAKTLFTVNGKLTAIAQAPEKPQWGLKIRADWLSNLNLKVPTTVDEFYDVLKKFTFNDPDKDGKNNTYGLTSAGEGKGVGEIEALQNIWGPDDFYIKSDGKVGHPIADGYRKQFLDFLRQAVKDKIIDPDWYAQGWDIKNQLLCGKGLVGVDYFPGTIATTADAMNGHEAKTAGWWESMAFPKGSSIGGKNTANLPYTAIKTVTAAAASNVNKMKAICKFINGITLPNEGYMKIRWGKDIDNYVDDVNFSKMDDGYTLWRDTEKGEYKRIQYPGEADYGVLNSTTNDKIVEGYGIRSVTSVITNLVKMNEDNYKFPTYSADASTLSFDPAIVKTLKDKQDEFEIMYILGKNNDFEGFKKDWLNSGGQKLLDSALAQWKAQGKIK